MNFEFPMKRIRSQQNSLHSNLLGNLIILSIFKIRVKERGDICSKKQTKFIGISFRKFNLRLHTRIEKNYYLCTGKIEREKMFRSCWLKSLNRWLNVIGSRGGKEENPISIECDVFPPVLFLFLFFFFEACFERNSIPRSIVSATSFYTPGEIKRKSY